jgi:hypothetical protein
MGQSSFGIIKIIKSTLLRKHGNKLMQVAMWFGARMVIV